MRRTRWSIAVAFALIAPAAFAKSFHFAVVGDAPYSSFERAELPGMLEHIAARQPAFIVHVGDIKAGNQRCDDAMYLDRRAVFDAVDAPLIYTPGDNEWTDCHRLSNGGYAPRERLDFLRQTFFATPRSLGRPTLPVSRQSDESAEFNYPENLRWQHAGVVFATLNVSGSDNNRRDRAEFSRRASANAAWLDAAFDSVKSNDAKALVLVIHGNPHFKAYASGKPKRGFRAFLDHLRRRVVAAPHPTVLIHGDTHNHIVDHPLLDDAGVPIGKFTRIESRGYPFLGWLHVTFDDDDKDGPVRVASHPWPPMPDPARDDRLTD